MTDDTERRLRESLRGANLPAAPASLRDAIDAVAASPAPVAPRRTWLRTLPALAAVVVLAIVAVAVGGGWGGQQASVVAPASPSAQATAAVVATPSPSTGASATPTEAPSPSASASDLLDADALLAEIRAVQGGAETAHDVVTSVGATPRQLNTFVATACSEGQGTCTLIAQLDGFDAATGSIVIRAEDRVMPPPADADSLKAPLALHIAADGSLELLGHMDLAPGSGELNMAALQAATETATPGRVVVALGWLGMATGSCGGAAGLGLPKPFDCTGNPTFLSAEPLVALVHDENGIGGTIDDRTVVRVGSRSEYRQFAPLPVVSNMNGLPRLGRYLVRLVAVEQEGCQQCRGWLVVGRLTPDPVPTPVPYDGTHVYSATELEQALLTDRSAWVGRAAMVEGKLGGPLPSCAVASTVDGGEPDCVVGYLLGTNEPVSVRSYTATLLRAAGLGNDAFVRKVVLVREHDLELLGMGDASSPDGVVSLADLSTLLSTAKPGEAFVVDAYLGWSGPVPCPSVPGSPPPADTPFSGCPWAWLSASAAKQAPADAVAVQSQAYADFAGTSAVSTTPVRAIYLVRLVIDPRPGEHSARGWQVIGRLSQ